VYVVTEDAESKWQTRRTIGDRWIVKP
jgi:hypothetical protein